MSIQSYVQTIGDTMLQGGRTARERVVIALWEKALDGDFRAIKLILDYDLAAGGDDGPPLADTIQADLDKVYGGEEDE